MNLWLRKWLVGLIVLVVAIVIACSCGPVNNSLAISRGIEAFPSCGCFGVWETLFGIVTPMQAMVYDIVLVMLAVIILVFHPTGFWHFRPWLIRKWKWEGIK